MSQPKLFIASSGRAIRIARKLENELRNREISAKVWQADKDSFHGGTNILQGLIEAGKNYDFAAVLLTKDDTVIRSNDSSQDLLNIPRDNCIFELGFFIGALNLKPERCFMLTSVERNALPSDLGGVIYYKIVEPLEAVSKEM